MDEEGLRRKLDESFQAHQRATQLQMIQAMKDNGMDPAYVYAVEKTGIMPFQENLQDFTEAELERWQAAYDEFTSGAQPGNN